VAETRAAEAPGVGVARDAVVPTGSTVGANSTERAVVETPGFLNVRCVSSDGGVVVGAMVQVWRDRALIEQASSDAAGVAILRGVSEDEPIRLLGSLAEHALASVTAGEGAESDFTLVFTPTDVIRGRVLDLDGDPVPFPRVAYWRSRAQFPMHTLEDQGAGIDSRGAYAGIAVGSETGEFTIPRPTREGSVRLLAAGSGLASRSAARIAPLSTEDASMTIGPVFGAFFRFTTTEYGGSLADPQLYSRGISYPSAGDGYESGALVDESLIFALLGLDFSKSNVDGKQYDEWLSFFGTRDIGGIPNIPVGIGVPGYEFWKGELTAYPLLPGVPVQEILLEPSTAGFGILIVDIGEQLPRVLARFSEPIPDRRAMILLSPLEGGRAITYPIRDAVDRKVEILGVPFGEYRVSLRSGSTQWRSCDAEECPIVNIGPTIAEVALSPALVGALDVEVFDANGSAYTGKLTLWLARGNQGTYVSLAGPPYLIYGLDSGDVSLSLRAAHGRLWDEAATPLGETTAVGGELIRMAVRLPE